jgi:hypothetical protein
VHAPKLLFLFLQMVVVVGMVVNQSEKKQMTHSMMMPMTHSMMMN